MSRGRTAILTVQVAMICGMPPAGLGADAPIGPPEGPQPPQHPEVVSLPTLPDRIEVRSPRRVAITRTDGIRLAGPWSGFDSEGVEGPDGITPWAGILAADRLRLGRELIRASGEETPEAWSVLLVALELSDAAEMADRARDRLRRVAVGDVDRWIAVVERVVSDVTTQRNIAADAAGAASMQIGRPHLLMSSVAGSAIPAHRLGRMPVDVERDRGELRRIVDIEVEGLGLETVPTAQVIAIGSGTLEQVAGVGVLMDRFLASTRSRLGTSSTTPLPAGGVAVIDPEDSDVARVLLARQRFDWPIDEPSILVPRPEGWIALLAEPDPARVRSWAAELPPGQVQTVMRQVELARIAARVAMLEAGAGRVPGWLVEGFAEAAAQAIVDAAPLERAGRRPTVAAIRDGRHPGWITSLPSSDDAWGADGDARRTAHLLVSRLLESGEAILPGIVRDLATGVDEDAAFQRWTGRTRSGWFDDCVDWYRTND